MDWRKVAVAITAFGICQSARGQSPTYGLGRAPGLDEVRIWDISVSPTGKELPQGHGNAREGAALFVSKGCGG